MTSISGHRRSRLVERVDAACASGLDERALRAAILEIVRPVVGFDAYVWLLTDPETSVGSAPLADVPGRPDLPTLIKAKYLSRVNRWNLLPDNGIPARLSTAAGATAGDPSPWEALLAADGVVDVTSMAFRDRHGCWGSLDLWRGRGRATFSDGELELLAATQRIVTAALRRRQAATYTGAGSGPPVADGPAVLILDDDLQITSQTGAATEWLRRLLPTTTGIAPIPAAAFNVAAQLLAAEAGVDDNPPSARTHAAGLSWVTLRASRLVDVRPERSRRPPTIVVTIEETSAAGRLDLYARSHALTPRESDLLQLLARGLETRELATAMRVRDVTVHDHLKAIFAKTGLNTRTAVLTAALGPVAVPTEVRSRTAVRAPVPALQPRRAGPT